MACPEASGALAVALAAYGQRGAPHWVRRRVGSRSTCTLPCWERREGTPWRFPLRAVLSGPRPRLLPPPQTALRSQERPPPTGGSRGARPAPASPGTTCATPRRKEPAGG